MRYAGLIKNDTSAAPGISVSFYTQGCPHRCKGCHNPETWDYEGGMEFTPDILAEVVEALTANGVQRNLCILGGEPLCENNSFLTLLLITEVRKRLPEVTVWLWTGYYYEELRSKNNCHIKQILDKCDYLVDGPFILDKRDVTLPLVGSSNQSVINLKEMRNNS